MIRFCHLWSSTAIQWSKYNLTWAECEMVQEICQVWSTTKFPWANANWKWSECSASVPVPVVVIGNLPGVDAETLIQPWQLEEPWNPYRTGSLDKQKRLIKLICKVKNEFYNEEKEVGSYKVTIGDIRMVVKELSGIELKINDPR